MRLYTKKIPAKEAAKVFENRVKSHVNPNELRQKISDDVEKARFSQMEWTKAGENTSCHLDQKLKEPRSILFSKERFLNAHLMIIKDHLLNHKLPHFLNYQRWNVWKGGRKLKF